MSAEIIIPELPEKLKRLSKEEERIIKESICLLKSEALFDRYLTTYECAMDVVYSLTKEYHNKNDDELTVQYIGIRLFNAMSTSLRLMLSGYYQISFALQRDLLETGFLLDYFISFPEKINEWKISSNKDRVDNFRPGVIRKALDERDGLVNKRRAKRYELFCEYAAHASYPGNKLVAPKGLGEIGPFFNQKFLRACFNELALNGFYSTLLFMGLFRDIKDKKILKTKSVFLEGMASWYKEKFDRELDVGFEVINELLDKLFEGS